MCIHAGFSSQSCYFSGEVRNTEYVVNRQKPTKSDPPIKSNSESLPLKIRFQMSQKVKGLVLPLPSWPPGARNVRLRDFGICWVLVIFLRIGIPWESSPFCTT